MSATVIILPVVRPLNGDPELPVTCRLPRKVMARLRRQAEAWNIDVQAAAEDILITAINEYAGVKR